MLDNLTATQKAMLKNLALLAAFYFGVKATSKIVRYGIMAGLGYMILKSHKDASSGVSGFGMKIDPSMAIDMLFPTLQPDKKAYAKLAASEMIKGMFPSHPGIEVGKL